MMRYLDSKSAGDAYAGLPDGTLLKCYVDRADARAFTTLLERHGPMVLAVCRRVLRNAQDCEDAFQVTFLVLATNARRIAEPGFVGTWLYEVATRTSLKLRATTCRRTAREGRFARLVRPWTVTKAAESSDNAEAIDAEISRLPEKYRRVVVACCVQGKSRREAAALLGWPEGTVSSRLNQARATLRRRLGHRNFDGREPESEKILARRLAPAVVPAALSAATADAAAAIGAAGPAVAGAVSGKVGALVKGASKAMFISKLKIAAAVGGVSLAVLGTTGAIASRGTTAPVAFSRPQASAVEKALAPLETPKPGKLAQVSDDDRSAATDSGFVRPALPPADRVQVAMNQASRAAIDDREAKACFADLRILVMALQLYTVDHDGHLPRDLGETVPYVLRGNSTGQVTRAALMYVCPRDRDKVKLPEKLTAEWVKQNTSYLYIGNPDVRLLDMHEGAYKMVWVYEKPEGGHDGKISVGYADGHASGIDKNKIGEVVAESKVLMERAR